MLKHDFVNTVLRGHKNQVPVQPTSQAFAPTNIALCKYWGKRHQQLHLPMTSSLSVTLPNIGTDTEVSTHQGDGDQITLNNELMAPTSEFHQRLTKFLDLFRLDHHYFQVKTISTIPVAAGFASSASGFAAITLALNNLYGWDLSRTELSLLARLGSGSACRSLWPGFVEWQKGEREDGLDSHGVPLDQPWPDLHIGIIVIDAGQKSIGSTSAMAKTVAETILYQSWPAQVDHDMAALKRAIATQDFDLLGQTAETNTLAMHATMIAAQVIYWSPQTVALIHKIHEARQQGLKVYFTEDAGPNIKLIYRQQDAADIKRMFAPNYVITPFAQETPL